MARCVVGEWTLSSPPHHYWSGDSHTVGGGGAGHKVEYGGHLGLVHPRPLPDFAFWSPGDVGISVVYLGSLGIIFRCVIDV